MTELAHEPETGTGRLPSSLLRRLVAEALGTGSPEIQVETSSTVGSSAMNVSWGWNARPAVERGGSMRVFRDR
jgi:hypothetical protein